MRLPNADAAVVERRKLDRYLLSPTHPLGRSKATLFRRMGFDESSVALLGQALIDIARTEDVAEVAESPYGKKYIVDGLLPTPSRGRVKLRTVWIVDAGETRPRFVTAYPI